MQENDSGKERGLIEFVLIMISLLILTTFFLMYAYFVKGASFSTNVFEGLFSLLGAVVLIFAIGFTVFNPRRDKSIFPLTRRRYELFGFISIVFFSYACIVLIALSALLLSSYAINGVRLINYYEFSSVTSVLLYSLIAYLVFFAVGFIFLDLSIHREEKR